MSNILRIKLFAAADPDELERLANDWLSGRRIKLEQLGFAADGLELPYNLCLAYRDVPPPYGGKETEDEE